MGELLYLNGEFMAPSEGRVSAEDRGFNFADGVYEVMRVYGGEIFTAREHFERFEQSAAGIDMTLPRSVEDYIGLSEELVERSGLEDAVIYIQVTRGSSPRNHICPDGICATEMAFIRPAAVRPASWSEEGVAALPMLDLRWNMCHLKTIALLANIVAKNRAHRAGALEALFHLEDGTVTEGSASNAYSVKDGVITTAPLGPKILPGITRMQILEIAQELGIEVRERAQKLEEYEAADEVLLSATNLEIVPVVRLGERRIGGGKPGPVFGTLYEAYRERVAERCGLAARMHN